MVSNGGVSAGTLCSLQCSQKPAACVFVHALPPLRVCVCVWADACVCVFSRQNAPLQRQTCSTIPPLLSRRHFTHTGADANQLCLLAVYAEREKTRQKLRKEEKRRSKRKTWIDEKGESNIRSVEFGIRESSAGRAVRACLCSSFVLVCVKFRGYKGIWVRVEGVKEGSDVRH